MGASSSIDKASFAKHLGVQVVEPHGLTRFNTQTKAKYAPKHWIDEGHLAQEFPTIRDKLRELGVGYIIAEPQECNLILVREFYANWDTSFGESTKLKIRGRSIVSFP
ncbi:hypothetical protein HAX54_021924 [Datura stramonium]|uniref:Uncharacterized protein n=1 Tax=Datura stramonium TaxID=4076 RepID=A0ABS8UTF1_DATST|nr:hypothetical protein [Datura stramonium]